MCWLKDLVKIHLKLTFANNILLEKINYPSMTLIIPTLFETKKYSSQQQQVKQEMKIWSQVEPVQCRKKYKQQSLLSSKVSNSHIQVPSYQTNTTSKLNEYMNKLTLPYFNSIVIKNFFNRYIKTLLKSRYDWFLTYRYFIIFQCLVKFLSGKT